MEKGRPSAAFFPPFILLVLLWGMGLHGNSEVSDVCLVWSRGPRVLVHISTSVLWREETAAVFLRMRCQDNCDWSARPKNSLSVLQCKLVQSVCLCACTCVCLFVCVCVCVLSLTEALHGISSPSFGNTFLLKT